NYKQRQGATNSSSVTSSPLATSGHYLNSQYGVEFDYPRGWQVIDKIAVRGELARKLHELQRLNEELQDIDDEIAYTSGRKNESAEGVQGRNRSLAEPTGSTSGEEDRFEVEIGIDNQDFGL